MDALYTDEERLLRSTIREFAEAELAPLADRWDANEEFPWESLEALKHMELMGMTLSPELGGAGMSYTELAIVAEEIARVCMTTSTTHLTHVSLSEASIDRFGTEEQRRRFLPKMATGEHLGAFGLTEPSSGSDASDMQTTFTLQGKNSYLLHSAKTFITNGAEADVMVVFTSKAG